MEILLWIKRWLDLKLIYFGKEKKKRKSCKKYVQIENKINEMYGITVGMFRKTNQEYKKPASQSILDVRLCIFECPRHFIHSYISALV